MRLDPYRGKIRCLQCGYPLLGLPPVHCCPECGLPYDPYSRLIRLPRRRPRPALFVATLAAAALFTVVTGGSHWALFAPPCAAFVVVAPFAIRRVLQKPAISTRLLIDRTGILLERPGHEPFRLPWSRFRTAHVNWASGRLRVYDRGNRRVTELELRLAPYHVAYDMAERLNELARIYDELRLDACAHQDNPADAQPQK